MIDHIYLILILTTCGHFSHFSIQFSSHEAEKTKNDEPRKYTGAAVPYCNDHCVPEKKTEDTY